MHASVVLEKNDHQVRDSLGVFPVHLHNALHPFAELLHPHQLVLLLHALQELGELRGDGDQIRPQHRKGRGVKKKTTLLISSHLFFYVEKGPVVIILRGT